MDGKIIMSHKKATKKETVEALRSVTISFKDLLNGLRESSKKTPNRRRKVLKVEGVVIDEYFF